MTALLEKIEREAKQLSREERERLATDLIAGLEDASLSEIDQAWIDEAERRYDDREQRASARDGHPTVGDTLPGVLSGCEQVVLAHDFPFNLLAFQTLSALPRTRDRGSSFPPLSL